MKTIQIEQHVPAAAGIVTEQVHVADLAQHCRDAYETTEKEVKTLGQAGYEAYRAHTGGISLASGQPIPEWDQLKQEIREAWEAAGTAICEYASS